MAGVAAQTLGLRQATPGQKRPYSEMNKTPAVDGKGNPLPVIVKLLCPIERTGPVIGKGGEVIRAIRGETGAKVKMEDTVPGQVERVITIQGPEKPGAPSCPTQDALQKVLARVVEIEGADGVAVIPEQTAASIIVDRAFVGYIVGKGGESIKAISRDSEASVTTLKTNKSTALVAPVEECIMVSGSYGAVKKALHLLMEKIRDCLSRGVIPVALQQQQQQQQQQAQGGARPGMMGGPGMPPMGGVPGIGGPGIGARGPAGMPGMGMMGAPGVMPTGGANFMVQAEYRVMVPDHRVGGLIGKNGEHLMRIRNATHADVHVSVKTEGVDARLVTCRSVEPVQSATCGSAEALVRVVQHVLYEKPAPLGPDAHPLEAVAAAAAAAAAASADKVVKIVCLQRQLGAVIGIKGAMIKQLAADTRARLAVEKDGMPAGLGLPGDEVLKIEGSQQSVVAAVRAVTVLLRGIMIKNQADNKGAAATPAFGVPQPQQFMPMMQNPLGGPTGWPNVAPPLGGPAPYKHAVAGPAPPPYPPAGFPMSRQAPHPPGPQPPAAAPPNYYAQPYVPGPVPPPGNPAGPPQHAPWSGNVYTGQVPGPAPPTGAPYSYPAGSAPPAGNPPPAGSAPPQQYGSTTAPQSASAAAPSGAAPAGTPQYQQGPAPSQAAGTQPAVYPLQQAYSASAPAAGAPLAGAPPAAAPQQSDQQQQAYQYAQYQYAQQQAAAGAQPAGPAAGAAYPQQPQDPAAAAYYYAQAAGQTPSQAAPSGYGAPSQAPGATAAAPYYDYYAAQAAAQAAGQYAAAAAPAQPPAYSWAPAPYAASGSSAAPAPQQAAGAAQINGQPQQAAAAAAYSSAYGATGYPQGYAQGYTQ